MGSSSLSSSALNTVPFSGYGWCFAQHSPNTSNLLSPQRFTATILMLKKDRNCLLEWGILSIKPAEHWRLCCGCVAAWGRNRGVINTVLLMRPTEKTATCGSPKPESLPVYNLLFRVLLPIVIVCVCIHTYPDRDWKALKSKYAFYLSNSTCRNWS